MSAVFSYQVTDSNKEVIITLIYLFNFLMLNIWMDFYFEKGQVFLWQMLKLILKI